MAKTTAPLLSFEGAGQIGKTMVHAKWKGVSYVRRYVVPANPNTTAQQTTRNAFKYLVGTYKFLDAAATAPWTAYAKGKKLTAWNAYQKINLPLIRGASDNTSMLGSPGAYGGIAASSVSASDSGSQVCTVTMPAPTVPDGWTLTDTVAQLVPKVTVFTGDTFDSYTTRAGATSGTVDVTAVAGDFVVNGWFEMTKPDGTTAYGESKATTVTLA